MTVEELRQKLSRLEKYIRIIENLSADCDRNFNDDLYRGALLYYLYLMADSCVAIAEMVIKYKSLRAPQSYAEAFDILGENGILEPEFAYSFAKIAGFRNFLAHDYETINKDVICNRILERLIDVKKFMSKIKGLF